MSGMLMAHQVCWNILPMELAMIYYSPKDNWLIYNRSFLRCGNAVPLPGRRAGGGDWHSVWSLLVNRQGCSVTQLCESVLYFLLDGPTRGYVAADGWDFHESFIEHAYALLFCLQCPLLLSSRSMLNCCVSVPNSDYVGPPSAGGCNRSSS